MASLEGASLAATLAHEGFSYERFGSTSRCDGGRDGNRMQLFHASRRISAERQEHRYRTADGSSGRRRNRYRANDLYCTNGDGNRR